MLKFWKWLIGFTITFTLLGNNPRSGVIGQPTGCVYTFISDDLKNFDAHCRGEHISEVPNLSSKKELKIVIFENTNPMDLGKDTFVRYSHLWQFMILNPIKNGRKTTTHESTFLPLQNLALLKLEKTYYTTNFNWPASITHLSLNGNSFTQLNIANLNLLRNLSVSECGLHDVPKIHELASINMLNIDDNPLDELTAESLARYCLLDVLDMTFVLSNPTTPEKHCNCTRLQEWLARLNLAGKNSVNCESSTKLTGCDSEFTDAKANLDSCLIRHGRPPSSSPSAPLPSSSIMVILIIALFVIVILSAAIFGAYYYMKKSKISESNEASGGAAVGDTNNESNENVVENEESNEGSGETEEIHEEE